MLLEEVNIDDKDVLFAGKPATDLDEINVSVLAKSSLKVYSEHVARLQY
jgi:hypothetical protein